MRQSVVAAVTDELYAEASAAFDAMREDEWVQLQYEAAATTDEDLVELQREAQAWISSEVGPRLRAFRAARLMRARGRTGRRVRGDRAPRSRRRATRRAARAAPS